MNFAPHFSMSLVISRQWPPSRHMPKNILSESGESLSNVTSRKRFVSALDQRCIRFRRRCSRRMAPRDTFLSQRM
jgi:hypothetical protein